MSALTIPARADGADAAAASMAKRAVAAKQSGAAAAAAGGARGAGGAPGAPAPATALSHPLPAKDAWASLLKFEPFQANKGTGLLRLAIPRKAAFQLASPDAPLTARPVGPPLETFDVAKLMDPTHNKGGMRIAVDMTPALWESLSGLDAVFDDAILAQPDKVLTERQMKSLRENSDSFLDLVRSRLAKTKPDGTPDLGLVTFRVMHRGEEVTGFETKQGNKGTYVSKTLWAPRETPLSDAATTFGMVRGGGGQFCRKLRHKGGFRPVGPGDFTGGKLHSFMVVPTHWASTNNGNFTVAVKVVDCIFENVDTVHLAPAGMVENNDFDDEEEAHAGDKRRAEDDGGAPAAHRPYNAVAGALAYEASLAEEAAAAAEDAMAANAAADAEAAVGGGGGGA